MVKALNLFRLEFEAAGNASREQLQAHVAANSHRTRVHFGRPSPLQVAVVGGGPSVADHLDELRNWKGPVWAVNNTAAWLAKHGVSCTLVAVDPRYIHSEAHPDILGAYFATCCAPELFAAWPDALAFDLSEDAEGGIIGGTTTAARMPMLALKMGYTHVHFFGCDSSNADNGVSHADRDEVGRKDLLVVRAGAKDYVTTPDYYLQCQDLTAICKALPEAFTCRSGGLFAAMLAHDDWEVVAVSDSLKQAIDAANPGESNFGVPFKENEA